MKKQVSVLLAASLMITSFTPVAFASGGTAPSTQSIASKFDSIKVNNPKKLVNAIKKLEENKFHEELISGIFGIIEEEELGDKIEEYYGINRASINSLVDALERLKEASDEDTAILISILESKTDPESEPKPLTPKQREYIENFIKEIDNVTSFNKLNAALIDNSKENKAEVLLKIINAVKESVKLEKDSSGKLKIDPNLDIIEDSFREIDKKFHTDKQIGKYIKKSLPLVNEIRKEVNVIINQNKFKNNLFIVAESLGIAKTESPGGGENPGEGGNPGGGGSSGGGGGSSSGSKDDTKTENESKGNGVVQVEEVKAQIKDGIAVVTVEKSETTSAIEEAAKGVKGNKTAQVIIPVSGTKDANIQVKLDSSIITKASENKVDLVIKSEHIEYIIPWNALNKLKLGSDETVELNSREVENNEITGKKPSDKVVKVVEFKLLVVSKDDSKEITNFNKPIEIRINAKGLGNANKLGVYYVNKEGKVLEFVGGRVKDGFIKMKTKHYSEYAIIERNVSFPDVASHWAKENIESMGAKNILDGYKDGTFKPENDITRAEFVKTVVTALELEIEKYNGKYSDVKSGDWHADYIATAQANDLIKGYEDGTFNPNGKITRAEMMTLLSRALEGDSVTGSEIESTLASFTDGSSVEGWAKEGVAKAVKAGLVNGINGNIEGKGQSTRAQVATTIYRLYNK